MWLILHGFLLFQLQPVFFTNRLDLTRNLLMLTDLQHAIIAHPALQITFDVLYIIFPLALLLSHVNNLKIQYPIAVLHALFNLVYAMQVTSMSTLSIEGYITWILVPLVFAFRSMKTFYYLLHLMRYFFILIFVSAALWKFRAGGVFNIEQMAGILLKQHTGYLWSNPDDWFSRFIRFLSEHTILSWSIYLAATLTELFFIIGFFTRKYDRLLIVLFILFLLTNFFVMRINYISWFVFTGCLWFARYAEPVYNTASTVSKYKTSTGIKTG